MRRRTAPRWLGVAAAALLPLVARSADGADPCASPAGSVSGRVTSRGATPIAGARVQVQGCTGAPVVTDASGVFALPVPAGAQIVTAAADGWYNGCAGPDPGTCAPVAAGATGVAVVLDPLPTDDDPAHVFSDPSVCNLCHADIVQQWNGSTMAHTNQNRWVDNLYNGTDVSMPAGPPADPQNPPYFGFLSRHNADARSPARTGECANCHQPEYVGPAPTDTNFNGFSTAQRHGVSCDFCHKIVDVDVSPGGIVRPNLVVGQLGVPAKTTVLRSASQPWVELGPLDDAVFTDLTYMRAGHAAVTASSRLCAACHEDSADTRDPDGNFRGTYDGPASQLTYTEWAQSSFAAQGIQCQDCHMPPSGQNEFCSVVDVPRDPAQVRSHTFEGTTPEFLRRGVRLRARSVVSGSTVTVTAEVANVGAGHDVPTGVTLRNMILLVTAADGTGAPLTATSGSTVPNWGGVGDPAAGAFAGLPGKGYARVLVDDFLAENVLFTEAVRAFDNRIPAGQTDTSTYAFQLPPHWQKRDVRVTTRLFYRRAFKPIADQRKWNVPAGGNAHGTRGDGTDYDENFIVGQRTNFLVCRGGVAGVALSVAPTGALALTASLRLPRATHLDPAANGVQIGVLGTAAGSGALLDEEVDGFLSDPGSDTHQGSDPVESMRFDRRGRRGYRVTVAAQGLTVPIPAPRTLVLGLDSGDVCFRRTLRCKTKAGTLRCR